jgi:hypothetical protein
MRFFTEFIVSLMPRPFVSLRVTKGEEFRITNTVFPPIATQSQKGEDSGGMVGFDF